MQSRASSLQRQSLGPSALHTKGGRNTKSLPAKSQTICSPARLQSSAAAAPLIWGTCPLSPSPTAGWPAAALSAPAVAGLQGATVPEVRLALGSRVQPLANLRKPARAEPQWLVQVPTGLRLPPQARLGPKDSLPPPSWPAQPSTSSKAHQLRTYTCSLPRCSPS